MTAQIHRLLITIGSILTGLGGVWGLSDVQPLGIPVEVGAATALIAAIIMLIANAIRANYPTLES